MKRREFALCAAAAALPGLLALPARAQSDPGYVELNTRAPVDSPAGQIEVIEFFSYGCSHCRDFEPMFEAWKKTVPKDVTVRRAHVAFQSSFEPLQRIYYALETLDQAEALQTRVFTALQSEGKRLDKPDVLFPWIAAQGVDRAKFEAAYKSFGVATKVRRAVQLQDAYQVEGTPALGIAGRFYTDGGMARFERMIQIANQLIEQVRQGG